MLNYFGGEGFCASDLVMNADVRYGVRMVDTFCRAAAITSHTHLNTPI